MLVTRNLHKYMMDQVGMIDEINTHPRELQKSQQEMKSGSLYEFSDYIQLTENGKFSSTSLSANLYIVCSIEEHGAS